MQTLNKVVSREGNVNFTTCKTAEEANNTISLFSELVNLSKFALSSSPERASAIQRIKYHLSNYGCTEQQRQVLEKVIELLCIGDIQVKSNMRIYKDDLMYYTREALLQLLRRDDILIVDPTNEKGEWNAEVEACTMKPDGLTDDEIVEYATQGGYVLLAGDSIFAQMGLIHDTLRKINVISVKTSLGY